MNWKTISSEYLNKHPYFTTRKDVCQKPDGTLIDPYFVVELRPTACALALTEEGQVIMTRQYRHPIAQTIPELPGGFMDEGESMEEAIARELLEETGYSFSAYTYLGKVAANPGVLDNFTHLYLATGGKKTAEQKLDDTEDVEVFLLPRQEVKAMLERNEFVQALHVCCLHYGLKRLDAFDLIHRPYPAG